MATDPITAIDIGGTKLAAARVVGGTLVERVQVATPRSGRFEDLVAAIDTMVPAAWRDGPVGVATTGFVHDGHLSAINPTTLPIPANSPIESALAAAFGVPVLAVNDAQAAAWGEYVEGAGRGSAAMGFVTVSTGVGGGIVERGRLLTGADGFGGHVGHVQVMLDGDMCGCGRVGCVESIASGTALARMASERFGRPVAAPELIELAQSDAVAREIFERAVVAIVALITNMRATSGIDRLVLGGSVGLNRAVFDAVARRLSGVRPVLRPTLHSTELGHDAGLVGAAALAHASALRR